MEDNTLNKKNHTQEILFALFIFCYFIVSLQTLSVFPFVHSDEAWLSGLTRNMLEVGSFGVTEPFYDLKPRYPHGIKLLFHLIQMAAIPVFGYQVFSFRLLSLIFACLSLVLFYALLRKMFQGLPEDREHRMNFLPLLGTMFLAFNVQFIYASHFARQEIILVFCIIACLVSLKKNNHMGAALITGLSIGLHPNSFLIGVMCLCLLMPLGAKGLKSFKKWKPLMVYTGITGAFAVFFVGISLSFDRNFLSHYFAYGNSEFEVGAPLSNKIAEFPYYLIKIWYQVSGTYYVPDIRLELLLFSSGIFGVLLLLFLDKTKNRKALIFLLKSLAGIILGMVLIGRYNQTSIIFLFPPLTGLLVYAVNGAFELLSAKKILPRIGRNMTLIVLIVLVAISSGLNMNPWLSTSYAGYLNQVAGTVAPDRKVLANLNLEYHFDNEMLLDYRNLSFLKQEGLSVKEYIRNNKIEYIILSDEMDLIYSQRPTWNMIYGNLRYLEELHAFTQEECLLVDSFQNNTYGVRILEYIHSDRDFTVKIFKVKNFTGQ